MFISEYLELGVMGHCNFDFVDVYLDDDNRLFIDPCLIEGADDPWSKNASWIVSSFFDCVFAGLKSNSLDPQTLFAHAGEQNATKLGYGNGENGKGKTASGLWYSLQGLSRLVKRIPTISRAQDIPVLVEGFAEDCMSDLLTNILHEPLNRFTSQQMQLWGCPPQGEKSIWTFNPLRCEWTYVPRPCWSYNGKEILLVPKWIVRRNYLFKVHQYLYSVIVERVRRENDWNDLRKIDIWNNLPRNSPHWEYETAIEYTVAHPETLDEYHNCMPSFYHRANGHMSDDDLDRATYGAVRPIVA